MPKIEVDIVGDVSGLGRELQRGAGSVKGFASQTGSVLKGVLGANLIGKGIGAAVDGVRALGGVLSDSIGEARESQKVGAVTAQVIKATGGAAKVSADQVGDLASSLSNKAGIDDEVIQSGANLLLTFKNVRNEAGKGSKIFDRATAAAVDLSATGFGSVEGSSKMLGKALNDPVKGISALGRAGVTFTAQQKEQIKALTETGDVLGAQKIILGEVEAQVGGVAAAQATAGEKAKVMGDNLKEQLGTALLPTLDKLANFFTTTLGPAISRGIDMVAPALEGISGFIGPVVDKIISIGTALTAGLSGGGISTFIAQLAPLGTIVSGIVAQVGPAVLGIAGQITGLVQTLAPTISGLIGSIAGIVQAVLPSLLGVVSSVVGAVTVIMPIVAQVIGTVVAAIQANLPTIIGVFNSIKETVTSVVSIITSAWSLLGPIILPILTSVFTAVISIIGGALKIVSGIVKTISAVLKGDWSGAWNGIKQIVSGVVQIVMAVVRNFANQIGIVFRAIRPAAAAAWNGVTSAVIGAVSRLVSSVVSKANDIKSRFTSAANSTKSAVVSAFTALVSGVTSKISGLITTVSAIPGRIKAALSGLGSLLVASGSAMISGLAQGIRNAGAAAVDAVKGVIANVRAYLPFSPAKKGPFSGRGWTLYSGMAIGESLAEGIERSQRQAASAAAQLARAAVPQALRADVGVATAGGRSASAAAGTARGTLVQQTNYITQPEDPRVIAYALGRGVANALAAG